MFNENNIPNSYATGSQSPLDSKGYFENEDDMKNVADFRPLKWFKNMTAVNMSTGKEYVWKESETGVIEEGYTYPNNVVSFGIDYSNKTYNFVLKSPESSGDLNVNDSKILATTQATNSLKQIVESLPKQKVGSSSDLDEEILNGMYPLATNPIGTIHVDTDPENEGLYVRVGNTEWMLFENKEALKSYFDVIYPKKEDTVTKLNITKHVNGDVYYLDSSIVDSSESSPNDIDKPFHSLEEAVAIINSNPDDGKNIEIFFLKGGSYQGCELPFRNITFNSESPTTIDFTGVNTIDQTNNTTNIGKIISSSINESDLERKYCFKGEISLISNTTDKQQSFSSYYGKFTIEGNIENFDFKCLSGTVNNQHNSILYASEESNLTINVFEARSKASFYFKKKSKVIINNFNCRTKTYLLSSDIYDLTLRNVSFLPSTSSADFIPSKCNLTIERMTGEGFMWTYHRSNELFINFKNCDIINGAYVYFGGGTLSGVVNSSYVSITEQYSPYDGTIKNLKAKINRISVAGLFFEGVNYLETNGNLALLNSQSLVVSGLTVIETETPSGALFTSNTGKFIIEKGKIITNSDNLGLNLITENNSLRGVEVQDENGIKKWISKDLKFKGFELNVGEKTISSIPIIANTLFVNDFYGNDSEALKGSPNHPFKTLDAALVFALNDLEVHTINITDSSNHIVTEKIPPSNISINSQQNCTISLNGSGNWCNLDIVTSSRMVEFNIPNGTLNLTPDLPMQYGTNQGHERQNLKIVCFDLITNSNFSFTNMLTFDLEVANLTTLNGYLMLTGYDYRGTHKVVLNKVISSSESVIVLNADCKNFYIKFNEVISDSIFTIAKNIKNGIIDFGNLTCASGSILGSGHVLNTSVNFNNSIINGNVYMSEINYTFNVTFKGKATFNDSLEILRRQTSNLTEIYFDHVDLSIPNGSLFGYRHFYAQATFNNCHFKIGGQISLGWNDEVSASTRPAFVFIGINTIYKINGDGTEIMSTGNHLLLEPYIDVYGEIVTNGYIPSYYKINNKVYNKSKKYVALLDQTGTNDPVARVLENSLGTDITWSRTGAGTYDAIPTASNTFVNDKTVVLISKGIAGNTQTRINSSNIPNGNKVSLSTYINGVGTDDQIEESTIEIRVYN